MSTEKDAELRLVHSYFHDPEIGTYSGHDVMVAHCYVCRELGTLIAAEVEKARAEQREKDAVIAERYITARSTFTEDFIVGRIIAAIREGGTNND